LQPLAALTVPAQQGYTLPLLANTGATDAQTYTASSNNPDIPVTIPTGPFWTLGVSYTDPTNAANDFSGNLTLQMFQNLTPNTVSEISNLTNDGYYVNSGKYFSRIISGFVVQGGAPNPDGSEPNPPVTFANENLQQLAFTGIYQLAMANSGGTDSNTSQFFITLGPQNSSLGYNYTIFGQLLTGIDTVTKMAAVPVTVNGQASQPNHPVTITSASLASTNPNGVLLIDTTQAKAGETATITVTATDPTNGTVSRQSFVVTVGAYGGPTDPRINFRPFANSSTPIVPTDTATTIQLQGKSGYPDSTHPGSLNYSLLTQPTHGSVSNFNASNGTFTYTPATGFNGLDSLTYQVTATGPQATPATTASNPGTVTMLVGATDTHTSLVVDHNLVVTPPPRRDRPNNTIEVTQVPDAASASNASLIVTFDGVVDSKTFPTSVNRIFVFGGKLATNDITIDPSVTTIPATISSGQGIKGTLTAGSSPTREHGWYGHTTLVGGSGENELVGLAGGVRFKPTSTSRMIFAGTPGKRTPLLNAQPPKGTFYVLKNGHLVPLPNSVFKAPPFKGFKLEE
jgi:cyclophilin family peptidyl-prolyl cis-trans isomerase